MDDTELMSVLHGLLSIQIEQLEEIERLKHRISRLEQGFVFEEISGAPILDLSNVEITNLT
jgi:hypothetical protein